MVPVACLPYTLSSDAGHMMAKGEPFAACYWDTPEGRCFSLRSAEDGMDVSEIAKDYGGGGHKHAAGFRVPFHCVIEGETSVVQKNTWALNSTGWVKQDPVTSALGIKASYRGEEIIFGAKDGDSLLVTES